MSRPHTPAQNLAVSSRPGTPSRTSRPGTPSRRVQNYMTKAEMPNNLELADPRTQDRASDLIGTTTEALKDPPTEDELAKVRELAARLEKKK
ncbi:hypothetical protein JCM8547_007060 [Rhodosporidiobolus lusitaniae]